MDEEEAVLAGYCRSVDDAQQLVNILAAVQQQWTVIPEALMWELLSSQGLSTTDANSVKLASIATQIVVEKALRQAVQASDGTLDEAALRQALARHVPDFE